jgi:hypothetical protein
MKVYHRHHPLVCYGIFESIQVIYLGKTDFADKVQEMVDIFRLPEPMFLVLSCNTAVRPFEGELRSSGSYLPYVLDHCFAFVNPSQLGQSHAVSHSLFHFHHTDTELFAQTTFNPLECLSDVTKILVSDELFALAIHPVGIQPS